MSSLRNAVKRITHKERRQPQHREHLGILQKKKDYRVRATVYHRQQDRIHRAQEAANLRNPDEFYFGMHNAQINDNGKHRKTMQARQAELDMGTATIRIMKQQDVAHIRLQRQQELKKIAKLRESLHFVGIQEEEGTNKATHTIFVETEEEARNFDAAKHFDTLPELVHQTHHRPRVATVNDEDVDGAEEARRNIRKQMRKMDRLRKAQYSELETRLKRVETLEKAEAHLVTERNLTLKGGRKRKIKPSENGRPAVYKWRSKRQK